MLALGMTANGADGQTLSQMERVLGNMPVGQLNGYLYDYVKGLPQGDNYKLNTANSIWMIPDIEVGKDFLQKNDQYYSPEVFRREFNGQTVEEINNWVSEKTDGMIEKMIEVLDPATVMCLVNAVVFEARWKKNYYKENIISGKFSAPDGEKTVEFMRSTEGVYLDDGFAMGFIKPYEGGYSFVALLPNEGVSIDEYVSGLTGERFLSIIENSQDELVNAYLPKFSFGYSIILNGALKSLGMKDAFSSEDADFSKVGRVPYGNIYIDSVLHKAHITVNELGTRAGAATIVTIPGCGWIRETVKLDRPFV